MVAAIYQRSSENAAKILDCGRLQKHKTSTFAVSIPVPIPVLIPFTSIVVVAAVGVSGGFGIGYGIGGRSITRKELLLAALLVGDFPPGGAGVPIARAGLCFRIAPAHERKGERHVRYLSLRCEVVLNLPPCYVVRRSNAPSSRFLEMKKKEKELQSKEAELRRREQDLRRKEEAVVRGIHFLYGSIFGRP
ncbi:Secretory carrier-associated membrane protein [Arachis hypogaea]|nr:Secretory carrier-associated membrane protein [Arachis hypogaea]